MDPDQTNCFVLSDLGLSADDISVESIELTKCEPDILFVERRPDQIPQNVLSLPSISQKVWIKILGPFCLFGQA